MTPNNNFNILPFYSTLQKQNHRKDYAFGEVYPLFCPSSKILPFQILRDTREDSVTSVLLVRLDTSETTDITAQMINTGLMVNRYAEYGQDVIMYHGRFLLSSPIPEGRYYIELSDGVQTWYSEVLTFVRSVEDYLKIRYWDSNSFMFEGGRIDFTNTFKFEVYLPTQIGRPEYEFDEQVEKRDGYQFVEKQISEKTFRFNFVAPEYLLDALRITRMMDYVAITCKGDTYNADQFLITPKWQGGGYLASVEAEFQCDTVLKKLGGRDIFTTGGDFNNDFNDDFNN